MRILRVPFIVDTHVWIWLVDGTKGKLGPACVANLRAASDEARVWVPAISVWEVAMLESKRKITLSMDLRSWVDRALGAPGVRLADMTPHVAIESAQLPGDFHGDPADRLIVAAARTRNATLMTRDTGILVYAKRGHVNVFDASD